MVEVLVLSVPLDMVLVVAALALSVLLDVALIVLILILFVEPKRECLAVHSLSHTSMACILHPNFPSVWKTIEYLFC